MKRAALVVQHSVDAQLQTLRNWKRTQKKNVFSKAGPSLTERLSTRDPSTSYIWENVRQANDKISASEEVADNEIRDSLQAQADKAVSNTWRTDWITIDNSMYPSNMFANPHRVNDWKQPIRSLAPSSQLHFDEEVDPTFISNTTLLEGIIASTSSPERAWRAFAKCKSLDYQLPPMLLNRLSLLLLQVIPTTQKIIDRYKEVLHAKQENGGEIALWQWNGLIRNLRLGLRTIDNERYLQAVDVLQDIRIANMMHQSKNPNYKPLQPNSYTYKAILQVAIATKNKENVKHALRLAEGTNSVSTTSLTMMKYYHDVGDLNSARALVKEYADKGEDIGIAGVSSYIWAFARQGTLKPVLEVYKALRENIVPPGSVTWVAPPNRSSWSIRGGPKPRLINNDLLLFPHVKPNLVIYINVIQSLAYWGQFYKALEVYNDMLTTPNHERTWNVAAASPSPSPSPSPSSSETSSKTSSQSDPPEIPCYEPTRAIFRAFFIGFVRFGKIPWGQTPLSTQFPSSPKKRPPNKSKGWTIQTTSRGRNPTSNRKMIPHDKGAWNFQNLEILFRSFMSLGLREGPPASSLIRSILRAFDITSGGDERVLKIVWKTLERRFGALTAPTAYRDLAEEARNDPSCLMTHEPLKLQSTSG